MNGINEMYKKMKLSAGDVKKSKALFLAPCIHASFSEVRKGRIVVRVAFVVFSC